MPVGVEPVAEVLAALEGVVLKNQPLPGAAEIDLDPRIAPGVASSADFVLRRWAISVTAIAGLSAGGG